MKKSSLLSTAATGICESPAPDAAPEVAPLAVSPQHACKMLSVGSTRLYTLLAAGELESYHDGRSRRVVVASIHDYVQRRIAEQARDRVGRQQAPDPVATA